MGLDVYKNCITIIEPIFDGNHTAVKNYKVVAQDGSFPYPVFYGSYEKCIKWQEDNCKIQMT